MDRDSPTVKYLGEKISDILRNVDGNMRKVKSEKFLITLIDLNDLCH